MKYPQVVSMPSAVSDWLEEQLDARGIDAVLYTRYVLSLFHSHSLDVICPQDEDLHTLACLKKETTRGSAGSRKRFRRNTSDWWKYADADQLKRSAAVRCLMSASDQNCEIESLVDELCAKLKDIKSEVVKTAPQQVQKTRLKKKISLQEQAEKYYKAFPALNSKSAGIRMAAPSTPHNKQAVRRRKRRPQKPETHDDWYDLPVNLEELLLDTPTQNTTNALNHGHAHHNKFIPCGTNLTKTIWSEKIDLEWPESKTNKELSLLALNHVEGASAFALYDGNVKLAEPSFEGWSLFKYNNMVFGLGRGEHDNKEDLLVSERTHFKPIGHRDNGGVAKQNNEQQQYVDGASFVINNQLDSVTYRTTPQGSLYVDCEDGASKRYSYFNPENADFTLKFAVVQNDKSCQTQAQPIEELSYAPELTPVYPQPIKRQYTPIEQPTRPDSLEEVTWKQVSCGKCNGDAPTWSGPMADARGLEPKWDNQSLRDIWGGEAAAAAPPENNCLTCGLPPTGKQRERLREDVSQDGEQLLTDLNFWSFATRLEEDCLVQLTSLPTLRSVTL